MRKIAILAIGCAVILSIALLVAPSARAEISGSAHDFSGDTWNSGGEICAPCHTPHNALSNTVPLWNHAQTSSIFTLYSSTTLDASDLGQPAGVSKLCLSCHDGTVALDSFGGTTGSTTITGDTNLGTDLSDHHPVGFTYDSSLASTDGGLHDPSTSNSGLGGTIAADLLFSSSLECGSCHDVHDGRNQSSLLVMSNAGSALCLTCHDK